MPSYAERAAAWTPNPDFGQLEAVLRREKPTRPVAFEFFSNDGYNARLGGLPPPPEGINAERIRMTAAGFRQAGYDHVTVDAGKLGFQFPNSGRRKEQSCSLNEGVLIANRDDFDTFPWPDPARARWDLLEDAPPEGMRYLVGGPCGVLELTIRLLGYDNLCFHLVDDPELVDDVVSRIGESLIGYYERAVAFDTVGGLIGNDDWGFKTQPMLAPDDMRRLFVPWHKKIVDLAHEAGKVAVMHSCGNLKLLYDDIIDVIGYDGKHSYEDVILPVEQFWERYHERIAVIGGMDVDFLCRSEPDAVYRRCREMLERTDGGTAYALGSGNSIPEYVPFEQYCAMVVAGQDAR